MFISNIIISFLALVLVLIVRWYFVCLSYKIRLKNIPTLPQIPLIGALYILRSTQDFYLKALSYAEKLGRNGFAMIGFYPVLFTLDPKIYTKILNSPECIDKAFVYDVMDNAFGGSVLQASGPKWKSKRKLLNPGFHYHNVIKNVPIYNEHSNNLIKSLSETVGSNSIEISELLDDWAISQTYDALFGEIATGEGKQEFVKALKLITVILSERNIRILEYFNFTYFFTKNYWLEKKNLNIIFRHVDQIIKACKTKTEEGGQRGRSIIMDILIKELELHNYDMQSLAKEINTIIFAGYDTTATTTSFLLYHLSKHPQIQQKLYDEVVCILGNNSNQFITQDDANKMTYMDLVIKESMRLTTTVPLIGRILKKDVQIEGIVLPKDLTIVFLTYLMHLDSSHYPEPEKFIPERFLKENLDRNKFAYYPFSAGPRNCLGIKFAMLSMKIALAKILLNYEITDANHELVFDIRVTLFSKSGIKVGFRKREDKID